MLNQSQIKRLLKQCERIDSAYGDAIPTGLQTAWSRNIGWIQALRLVLEVNGPSQIKETPVDD